MSVCLSVEWRRVCPHMTSELFHTNTKEEKKLKKVKTTKKTKKKKN